MVKFLLKKSYSRKDLKEKEFKDLWNAHGVFTTMWIYGKPQKILFFKEHITNLIKSTKNYKIYDIFATLIYSATLNASYRLYKIKNLLEGKI